jgi:hypothetical protein
MSGLGVLNAGLAGLEFGDVLSALAPGLEADIDELADDAGERRGE